MPSKINSDEGKFCEYCLLHEGLRISGDNGHWLEYHKAVRSRSEGETSLAEAGDQEDEKYTAIAVDVDQVESLEEFEWWI